MYHTDDPAITLLLARVDDLCDRAARGTFAATAYLTPREAKYVAAHLTKIGHQNRARLWGGYPAAERVCLLLFPDYVTELYTAQAFDGVPVKELLLAAGEDDPTAALRLQGSGYRTLTHRDFLGALLSLGVERETLGDIAVDADGHGATILCTARIRPYLMQSTERIGGDVVQICPTDLPPDFDGGRMLLPLRDTIASPRLDCIVASLCHLSREAAQTVIRQGLVELDYECEQHPDRTVDPPAVISVRGKGKFRLVSIGAPTKKGRLPLLAEKYC